MIVDNLFRARATDKETYRVIMNYWCNKEKRDLEDCRRQIKRFEWYKKLGSGKVQQEELQIDRAKEFPIGEIMPTQPTGKCSGKQIYSCPFHSDSTPSFFVYLNNNTYFCFSCNSGGDAIQLYMELHDCEFMEACKNLI